MTDFLIDHAPALDTPPSTLGAMSIEIDTLKEQVEQITKQRDYWSSISRDQSTMIETAGEIVKDAIRDEDFERETLVSIGEALGTELTKELSVEFTVTFSGTVTVALDFEGDLEDCFDFECGQSWNAEGIQDCDISHDSTEVNVSDY